MVLYGRFNLPRSLPNTADVFFSHHMIEDHRQVDADLVAILSWPGTNVKDSMVG